MEKRLSKALQAAGVASRRAAEELIFEGRVRVNKVVVKIPQTLVDPDQVLIEVDGERVSTPEKKVYYLLNKPEGYLCTTTPPHPNSKKVLDLFADLPYRLFTVGRLDRDTTGLLIITNDGHFANRVIHPSFNITKEYLAKTGQEVTHEHLQTLAKGTYVEGTFVKPVEVRKVRRGTIKIIVKEGKKREVRILLENAGLEVRSLSRIRIGSLLLGTLSEGQRRPLTQAEIDAFLANKATSHSK